MNRFFPVTFFVFLSFTLIGSESSLKVLHLSFHLGCIRDFEDVGKELGLDVTSWYILSRDLPRTNFDGISTGNAVYNIGHNRAQRVWDLHKEYFDQFDLIITSDTAPLSRIFLQSGWKKPLIIWICNRFDYCDYGSRDEPFPDREYYDLFKKAATMENVKVIGYTPYEHYYAAQKGVTTGGRIIKPLGSLEQNMSREGITSLIPTEVSKDQTVFIYPRVDDNQLRYIEQKCAEIGIKTYSGRYNGPEDLKEFKGIIYFPYAWSNLAPFENFHRGLIHFVPSVAFIKEELKKRAPVMHITLDLFHLIEWYFPEYKDVIVYFDSWEDLKKKVETTDYETMRKKIKSFGRDHRETMLSRWKEVFNECKTLFIMS